MPPTASAGAFGAPVARSPCCQRQQVLVGGLLLRLVIDPVRLVLLLNERPGGIGQRADGLHEHGSHAHAAGSNGNWHARPIIEATYLKPVPSPPFILSRPVSPFSPLQQRRRNRDVVEGGVVKTRML